MQTAPYEQLLSSLAADVPYKLLSNDYDFSSLSHNIPGSVQLAEKNLGHHDRWTGNRGRYSAPPGSHRGCRGDAFDQPSEFR